MKQNNKNKNKQSDKKLDLELLNSVLLVHIESYKQAIKQVCDEKLGVKLVN